MSLGYVLGIGASILWGITYALDEQVLADLPVWKLMFLHSLSGLAISMIAWVFVSRSGHELVSFSEVSNLKLLGVTLAVGAVATFAIIGSIQSLDANRAALLEISYPIFVSLFAWLVFGEKMSVSTFVGGAVIFAGASIVILGNR